MFHKGVRAFLLTLCILCIRLTAEDAPLKVQHESFNEKQSICAYFKELFTDTSAGYVLFGDKPVYLGSLPSLHRFIPGTNKHRKAVQTRLGVRALENVLSKKGEGQYQVILPSNNDDSLLIINRKALLKTFEEHLLLFKATFGVNISPETLIDTFMTSTDRCLKLLDTSPALQGIVLGYGAENSIAFERGRGLMDRALKLKKITPPLSYSYLPKNQQEVINELDNTPAIKEEWNKIKKETEKFTFYRPKHSLDHLKIPFSFNPETKETKKLLEIYRKAQVNVDQALSSEKFFDLLTEKLRFQHKQVSPVDTKLSKTELSKIVALSILNAFPERITSDFLEGMNKSSSLVLPSNFLEILRDQSIALKERAKSSKLSVDYLSNLKETTCLIPNRLYKKIIKTSSSSNAFKPNYKSVVIDYTIYDINNNPIGGSYHLEKPPQFLVSRLIPGLAHGMLGMKTNEVREIYIHPDFAYGVYSDFGEGQAIKIKVKLLEVGELTDKSNLPFLKPYDVANDAPDISSCTEYNYLKKKYMQYCGYQMATHYRQAFNYLDLSQVIEFLSSEKRRPLTKTEESHLLNLEALIYQLE